MKKISNVLFIVVFTLTVTLTHAQVRRKNVDIKAVKVQRSGSPATLNPQPLPPKADKEITGQGAGTPVMLNPQPLPPKANKRIKMEGSKDTKMLNPQPLPPKVEKNIKEKNARTHKTAKQHVMSSKTSIKH